MLKVEMTSQSNVSVEPRNSAGLSKVRDAQWFGQCLRRARTERKLTVTELADCLGIAPRTIARYENGEVPQFIQSTVLERISTTFAVPIDTLLDKRHALPLRIAQDIDQLLKDKGAGLDWFERIVFQLALAIVTWRSDPVDGATKAASLYKQVEAEWWKADFLGVLHDRSGQAAEPSGGD